MRHPYPEESLKNALESLCNFGKTTTNIATNGISSNNGVGVTNLKHYIWAGGGMVDATVSKTVGLCP